MNMSSTEELKNMIYSFRVSELQDLLGFAGRNKTGKKQELQARALDLLKLRSAPVQMKILELHKRRFQVMSLVPSRQPEPPPRQSNVPSVPNSVEASHGMPRSSSMMPGNVAYGSNMNYSSSQVKALPLLNPGPSTSRAAVYPIHPDVKFKDLPFFDVLAVLLQPSSLSPSSNSGYQESHFQFHLSPGQVNDINGSRRYSSLPSVNNSEFDVQIQLRFCLLETSCEQEDNFPPSICVKLNARTCTLPNPVPTNKPGVEPKRPSRPVNITQFCRLTATAPNNLMVSWASDFSHRAYVLAVFLVRRLDSAILLSRLRSKGMRNPDHTRGMIKEKLQQSPDSEIATTSLRGSLMCPIGKMKMQVPCRPVTCTHLQCFDASLFLKMNEKKPRWICPVCDKPATFSSLSIDGLFSEISAKAPSRCTEVQFHEDGSWTPIIQETKLHDVDNGFESDTKPQKKRADTEVIDLTLDSDTDEDDEWSRPSTSYAQRPLKMFKSSSSDMGASSSSMLYQPKIPSTAPFIALPSPTTPPLLSAYENIASTSGLNENGSPAPSTSFSMPHTLMKPQSPGPASIPSKIEQHPSTSRDMGFGSPIYPNMPFINPSRSYYSATPPPPATVASAAASAAIPAIPTPPLASHSEMTASTSQPYNADQDFDLYTLLQTSESDQQGTEDDKSASSTPDIISLD